MLRRLGKIAAHGSRAFDLVQRLNQNRVRILMYHRFPRRHSQSFDKQCAFLAAKYNVVPLVEAVRRLARQEPVADMAVITVDDGYADMHEVAFPILRRYGLPATLFVTTGFVNRTCWMPGDRVRYHFAQTTEPTVRVTDHEGHEHVFRTKGKNATSDLRALLKRVPERTRDRILYELDGNPPVLQGAEMTDEYRPCTWAQLRELAEGGVSVGAHTVTHPILRQMETAQGTEREIVQSKREIEDALQRPVDTFAYPNGLREDIDGVSAACVRAHFKGAVTAIHGLNAPGSDVFDLSRLACEPEMSVPELARLMAGPLWSRADTVATAELNYSTH